MSFDDFVDKYLGQQITDNSGNYWGECVSYVKRYAQEVQGVANADAALYVKGDLAKNLYLDPIADTLAYYDRESSPLPGDIAVYGNPNNSSYGDVAVVLNDSEVVGQLGFPVYHPIAKRNIGSPLGYLRRKGESMASTVEILQSALNKYKLDAETYESAMNAAREADRIHESALNAANERIKQLEFGISKQSVLDYVNKNLS